MHTDIGYATRDLLSLNMLKQGEILEGGISGAEPMGNIR